MDYCCTNTPEMTKSSRKENGVAVNATPNSFEERIEEHHPHLLEQVLLYVLSIVQDKGNVGETVLQKLLYFIDFDYFEKYEENFMGETYLRKTFGPMNMRLQPELQRLQETGLIEKGKYNYFGKTQTYYRVVGDARWNDLTSHHLAHIDDVLNRLSDYNARQISEYSHDDIPWRCTIPGKAIPYELVFYRGDRHSVKEYDDEI